jgi:hypothetical protein
LFLFGDRKEGFPTFLPLWLFPTKPSRPGPGASAALPTEEAVPPPVSLGVYARAGPILSWALRPLGHSRPKCPRKSVSLFLTPLVLSSGQPHDYPEAEPQGFQAFRTWRFPPKRAPARMAFSTDGPALPFWVSTRSGLFFRLRHPTSLARYQQALLAADVLPPNGR